MDIRPGNEISFYSLCLILFWNQFSESAALKKKSVCSDTENLKKKQRRKIAAGRKGKSVEVKEWV